MEDVPEISIVIVGGDELALRVCQELMDHAGQHVHLLWKPGAGDLQKSVERLGGAFTPLTDDEEQSLVEAGIGTANVVIALTDDDHFNLRLALSARDLNPTIRVVMRQYNRTLGRKIEQNLVDCSVISLSSVSAATYAGAAVDPACYHAVQFPDIDGPLFGIVMKGARDAGVAGRSVVEAEDLLDGRILARNADPAYPRDVVLDPDDVLTYAAPVRPSPAQAAAARARAARRASWLQVFRALPRGFDPIVRVAIGAAVFVFLCGTIYFGFALGIDPITAAYFVVATMTTTGYGDISPEHAGLAGEVAAVALMIAGLVFSGIFIAILSSRFTQAQYVSVQGLRRLSRRGHVVVCGSGNVGSRVIDFLLRLECRVVVIEKSPTPEIVERARAGTFDLLTGDATKDATLEFANIADAAALVAITQNDTSNLEVALGARARVPDLPIVMRVQHETFQKSVRRHFGFDRTYGTAALAAPVLAGLAHSAGVRGRVMIGEFEYTIVEETLDATGAATFPDFVPLAVWRAGCVLRLDRLEDAHPSERILALFPSWRLRREPHRAAGVAFAQSS